MRSTAIEVRRARPLLGTIVEITARGSSEADLTQAVNSAFNAIERVHGLMSFHERHSDLGRVNRLAYRTAVRVHPWTWRVLSTAQRLSQTTCGAFDVTIGGELVRLGYLPFSTTRCDPQARWRDVHLLPGRSVRFRRPLLIDLGGIAKGFAVDRAVECLRSAGVHSGLVNAGGDLRAFGSVGWRIHVRHPSNPTSFVPFGEIATGALATSANYFVRRRERGKVLSPLIDGVRRRTVDTTFSASVSASTCMLADALTKLVLLQGRHAQGLVGRLGGQLYLLDASAPAPQLGSHPA